MTKGRYQYTISRGYAFVDNEPVLMYYIEGAPFTFDVLDDEQKNDLWVLSEAALNPDWTMEDMYRISDYLISEAMHPLLFEVDLINPEELPDEQVS